MEIALAGGAVIDVATREDIAAHHDRLDALLTRPGAHFQRLAAGTPTGAGPLVINLETPPRGMVWLPQWITLGGSDVFLAAGNAQLANVSAAVFAGALARATALTLGPPVTGVDSAGCLLAGVQVPSTQPFPDVSVVFGNENLYVVLAGSGLAAGSATVYRATCGVLEIAFKDLDAYLAGT